MKNLAALTHSITLVTVLVLLRPILPLPDYSSGASPNTVTHLKSNDPLYRDLTGGRRLVVGFPKSGDGIPANPIEIVRLGNGDITLR